MKRLLLISNSTQHGGGYLEHCRDDVRAFLGETVQTVLFVPVEDDRMTLCGQRGGVLFRRGEPRLDLDAGADLSFLLSQESPIRDTP